MENSFNENINLGGVVSSTTTDGIAVAPYGVTTTTTGTNETVVYEAPSTPMGVVQNMHLQVENVTETTTASEKIIEPIVYNEPIVPVAILKNLIANARKVGDYNQIRTISQVVLVELGDFGIKVNASNGKIEFESIDNTVKYSISLKACVDISELGGLLNILDCETITLNVVDNVLNIATPEGSTYKFPERVDLSTQQPIELNLTFDIKWEDMTEIDLDSFVNNIKQSKPIRDIPNLDDRYAGVFFSNLVLSSNRKIIYIQENQDILKTQKFFIGSDFCKLIADMSFNKGKFRIGFTTDSSNDIRAITLSDGRITMCGPVNATCAIPEDVCSRFWNAQYPHTITISTKKLTNALKRIDLFSTNEKSNFNDFEISGKNIRIVPDTNRVMENVLIDSNDTNFSGVAKLPRTLLENILNSIKSDRITFAFEDGEINFVGINAGEYKWIVSVGGEQE